MSHISPKVKFIIAVAILFCIVMAIWLPFSFNISPMWDVWAAYRLVQTGDAPFIRIDLGTLRPFTYIAWYTAYAIDSTSFAGINTLLITLLVAKGAAFYLIIRRLFPQLASSFALAAAAIATAHPGDPHALYSGSIGGHLGIFLFLMSVYLLLVFVDNGRWPVLAAALGCSLFSMGFSERTYPLVVLTLLLVVYKTQKLNRRAITAMGWWLASALPVFALYGFSFLSESYRRTNRLENSSLNPITLLEHTVGAFQQVFVDGWILPSTNITTSWLLITLAAGVTLVVILVFFQRDEAVVASGISQTHRRLVWLTIAGGLVVVAAGFATFAPLERYSTELKRTLYLSVFGGALTVTGILYLITSYLPAKRYLFPVSVGILLCFGVLNLQFMQQREHDAAIKQHTTLAVIAETVPSLPQGSALFVTFNDTEQFKAAQFSTDIGWQNSLSVLYGHRIGVCLVVPKIPSSCELTSDGVQFKILSKDEDEAGEMDEMDETVETRVSPPYSYEKVIGVRFGGRGGTVLMSTEHLLEFAPDNIVAEQIAQRYHPPVARSVDDAFPARYHTMLLPQATAPLDWTTESNVIKLASPNDDLWVTTSHGTFLTTLGVGHHQSSLLPVKTTDAQLIMMEVSAAPYALDEPTADTTPFLTITNVSTGQKIQSQRVDGRTSFTALLPLTSDVNQLELALHPENASQDTSTPAIEITEIALSTFSRAVTPQGSIPFVSIEGDGLTAAAHLRYPQQNELETDGEHAWLWLGDGVQQGVSLYLYADTPLTAQLTLAVKPGPSRDDQTRTLEIHNLETDQVSTLTFDAQTTVTSDRLALDAGLNHIQITVLETPDTAAPNGDPRSLLVLLDSVLVTTSK